MNIWIDNYRVTNGDKPKVELIWATGFRNKINGMIGVGGKLQQFIDSTILKGIEPYIPMRSGATTKSGINHTKIGSGMLIWRTPYIRYIYYGVLMVDPDYGVGAFYNPLTGQFWSRRGVRKIASERELTFDTSRHPKAGKLWSQRYLSDNRTRLSMAVNKMAGELWGK